MRNIIKLSAVAILLSLIPRRSSRQSMTMQSHDTNELDADDICQASQLTHKSSQKANTSSITDSP